TDTAPSAGYDMWAREELAPGEYVFTCGECDGKGEVEVGDRDYGDFDVIQCEDCHGDGEYGVDEEKADELINDLGFDPLRRP
ncbi:hypothetical protein, partial [Streptomyces rhizosphaericus]